MDNVHTSSPYILSFHPNTTYTSLTSHSTIHYTHTLAPLPSMYTSSILKPSPFPRVSSLSPYSLCYFPSHSLFMDPPRPFLSLHASHSLLFSPLASPHCPLLLYTSNSLPHTIPQCTSPAMVSPSLLTPKYFPLFKFILHVLSL